MIKQTKWTKKVNGSCFQRLIICENLYTLLDKLGKPSVIGSGDNKNQLEWIFTDKDKVITIYDWKDEKPIYNITRWHIGGKNISTKDIKTFFKNKKLFYEKE